MTERIKILLVEDNKVDQMAFERFIKREKLPYDYAVSRSVAEAEAVLATERFDVLVIDYLLGDGTMFDLFGEAGEVPIVVITGNGSEHIAVKAMKAGATDYLIKDQEGKYLTVLPVTVENAIHLRKTEIELRQHRQHLEELVEERTFELTRVNEQLVTKIAEHKQAKEALLISMETQNAILSTTNFLLAYLDREFNFIAVNQAYADGGRRRQEDFIGKNHFDFYPHAENEAIFRKVVETGEAEFIIAKPFEHPDQPERGMTWWNWSLIPMKDDESGSVRTLILSLMDVTGRVQAEKALQKAYDELEMRVEERTAELAESNEKLRIEVAERMQKEEELRLFKTIFEVSREAIAISVPEGRLVYINPAHEKLFGRSLEKAKKLNYRNYYPPESIEVLDRDVAPALARGEGWEGELDVFGASGRRFHLWERADSIHDAEGNMLYAFGLMHDVTERKRMENALQTRTHELTLLNESGRAFVSSLELDQVLSTVMDQVARIIGIVTCSIWLVDPESGDLVCREAIPPRDDIVRGWRLASGQGLVGWVLQHGEILNIANTRTDKRHFKGVDKQTGLKLRSILSVPLRTKNGVFGVLQLLDEAENRFGANDERLAESLATLAAIAIENARLYRQTQLDAETKTVLLEEINHRVKNNLIAITGMLYIEQRHAAKSPERHTDTALLNDMINRIKGLSIVHNLLSASEWSSQPLSELAQRLIASALQVLPSDRPVSVDILADAPVVVSPSEAHQLAIVINELATNVVKHVVPKKETVKITVRITPEPLAKTVLFEFRDNGPGFPEAVLNSEGHNVGMYLIKNTVRHSLRGEITFQNDNGAVVRMKFAVKIRQ